MFILRLLIAIACAFVFLFAGANKLSDAIDPDMHAKMVRKKTNSSAVELLSFYYFLLATLRVL